MLVALKHVKELEYAKPVNKVGIASLTRHAFSGQDLTEIASKLLIACTTAKNNSGMLMDLSVIEQLKGNRETGLNYQRRALIQHNLYRTFKNKTGKLRLLVLSAPIHMGGNTPVELLLENADVEIMTVFIAPGLPIPENIPPHDLIMIAAPGDTGSVVSIMPNITPAGYLREIQQFLDDVSIPVINKAEPIFQLERDVLPTTLKDIKGVVVPFTIRANVEALIRTMIEECPISDSNETIGFPFLIRPVGSHAGYGFELIKNSKDLGAYLSDYQYPEYFISNLINYQSDDGNFRKYRIIFVDGIAYPCHMAIGEDWKLWYLNAKMDESEAKRAEEADWMELFVQQMLPKFGSRLDAIAQKVGLDYFGIDCAVDQEGNLVIFEADNAMIVHDMDPPELYPYKKPVIQKLFAAFEKMLFERANISQMGDMPNSQIENNKKWVRVQ